MKFVTAIFALFLAMAPAPASANICCLAGWDCNPNTGKCVWNPCRFVRTC